MNNTIKISLLWFFMLCSCARNATCRIPYHSSCRIPYEDHKKEPSNAQKLRDLFPWNFIIGDTLKVYSCSTVSEANRCLPKGKLLDSVQLTLFPKYCSIAYNKSKPVYALGRFAINESSWGLMARFEDDYSLPVINLYIFNSFTDSIYFYRTLAEYMNDIDNVYQKTTWLFRDANKKMNAFSREDHQHYNVRMLSDTTGKRNSLFSKYIMPDAEDVLVMDSCYIAKFR